MQSDNLLSAARGIIDKVQYCFAITVMENGETHARVVQPRKVREDCSADFMTNRQSRKVKEIERTGKLTLAYQYDRDGAYVCLMGPARVLADIPLKRSMWTPDADRWFPGGPENPDVVIVRLETNRIELWSLADQIMPEPNGSKAAVVVRDGHEWRCSTT
jgi:general stress protein 26